jgi:hypothetical protein
MISPTGTIFSDTESIFSVPDTTFFATHKIFSVAQKTAGEAPAVSYPLNHGPVSTSTPRSTRRRWLTLALTCAFPRLEVRSASPQGPTLHEPSPNSQPICIPETEA